MLAKFVKFTSTKKTAICMVKSNAFALGGGQPVYLDADAVRAVTGQDKPEKGTAFSLPEGTTLVQMPSWINEETGEVVEAKTKEGIPLMTVAAV